MAEMKSWERCVPRAWPGSNGGPSLSPAAPYVVVVDDDGFSLRHSYSYSQTEISERGQ